MNKKLTMKQVKTNYDCIQISYNNDIDILMKYVTQEGYTAGVYGWNADIFSVPGTDIALVHGYRPFGRKADYFLISLLCKRIALLDKEGIDKDKIMNFIRFALSLCDMRNVRLACQIVFNYSAE